MTHEINESSNFYLKLTCKNCNGTTITDFEQIEGDIIPADTAINCPKSKSGKHEWYSYWPCPECDREWLFPVDDNGEPLQGRCNPCINGENPKLLN